MVEEVTVELLEVDTVELVEEMDVEVVEVSGHASRTE